MIISFNAVWSIDTHSSIRPPVLLCPLDVSLAAKMSIVEPLLKVYFTSSLDFLDTPRAQFISLLNAGMSLQISSIFAIVIDAACSFPPVVTNKLLFG